MIAGEAEVVGEHMAIEFFAELSTEGAAACTSSEPAEDGTRDCAEGDAKRAGNSADSSPIWPAARAALAPRAAPPTVPTAAPIFMAVCNDAILGELHRGHCNDMVLSSMGWMSWQ